MRYILSFLAVLVLGAAMIQPTAAAPSSGILYVNVDGLRFTVDMGEENDVSPEAARRFGPVAGQAGLVRIPDVLGRSIFAKTVTHAYLLHLWLDPTLDGVLGSDFLSKPMWMDFGGGRLLKDASPRVITAVPMRTKPFPMAKDRQTLTVSAFPISIGSTPVNCSLDTGTAGRFSAAATARIPGPALRAINVLAPDLFDKLRGNPGVVTIPDAVTTWTFTFKGPPTEVVPAMIVPEVGIGSLRLHDVVFVRRPERKLFPYFSRTLGEPIQAQCGGALLNGYTVLADFANHRLSIAK